MSLAALRALPRLAPLLREALREGAVVIEGDGLRTCWSPAGDITIRVLGALPDEPARLRHAALVRERLAPLWGVAAALRVGQRGLQLGLAAPSGYALWHGWSVGGLDLQVLVGIGLGGLGGLLGPAVGAALLRMLLRWLLVTG